MINKERNKILNSRKAHKYVADRFGINKVVVKKTLRKTLTLSATNTR